MARIELSGIRKEWGEVVAVEDMDLVIEDGEFVAVLGPSGCGKSTTLFMLAGIYAPSAGVMRFDGSLVNEVESRDRNVGIVFQSYALYPHMSVRENIAFPLRFKKVPTRRPGAGSRRSPGSCRCTTSSTAGPARCRAASSSGSRSRGPSSRSLSYCFSTSPCPTSTRPCA